MADGRDELALVDLDRDVLEDAELALSGRIREELADMVDLQKRHG
jgi:hypothetical protein